jgi:hypothetical protein
MGEYVKTKEMTLTEMGGGFFGGYALVPPFLSKGTATQFSDLPTGASILSNLLPVKEES